MEDPPSSDQRLAFRVALASTSLRVMFPPFLPQLLLVEPASPEPRRPWGPEPVMTVNPVPAESAMTYLKELSECCVCLDTAHAPMNFTCGHFACGSCALRCYAEKRQCPLCRRPTGVPVLSHALDGVFRSLVVPNLPAEDVARYETRLSIFRTSN